MNLSKFFFKIAVTLAYVLGLMLIILPIAWVIVYTKEEGWRYGFTFIKNNFEVALFVSFAIGFMVSVYHALKFELIGESPLSNFLKSTQVVNVKGEQSVKELVDSLQSNEYFWFKELKVNEDSNTINFGSEQRVFPLSMFKSHLENNLPTKIQIIRTRSSVIRDHP